MINDNNNGQLKHKEKFKRSKTTICKWSMFQCEDNQLCHHSWVIWDQAMAVKPCCCSNFNFNSIKFMIMEGLIM